MHNLKLYAKVKLDEKNSCLVYKSKIARSFRLSVSPDRGVRLIIPQLLFNKDKTILKILREKLPWIKKQLERQKNVQTNNKALKKHLTPRFKKEAKEKIIRRVSKLAQENGFNFNKVYVRDQKTRWGSCSHKKNLSFNFRLSLLPQNVTDYIIIHELIHLKHQNHSKKFWQEVTKYYPNYREYRQYLRKYTIM